MTSTTTDPGAGTDGTSSHLALAREVAARYAAHPQVEAVALGGSVATGHAGEASDIDLYLYLRDELPIAVRAAIAGAGAGSTYAEVPTLAVWEPGDEWVDGGTGLAVDVMFRDPAWIEAQLDRVLLRHLPSTGYTTCLWANVRGSVPLYDRAGWFAGLQQLASGPYPDELRAAIVAHNQPILRACKSAYRSQIAKAVGRRDLVSLNHRVAALLASYFDILFALNRVPHPGEKRLIELAERLCAERPVHLRRDVEVLVRASTGEGDLVAAVDRLVDPLDALIVRAGISAQART